MIELLSMFQGVRWDNPVNSKMNKKVDLHDVDGTKFIYQFVKRKQHFLGDNFYLREEKLLDGSFLPFFT